MNIIDIIIILFILSFGIIGLKRGFIKQIVMFVGLALVVVLAFSLKNNVAIFMYEKLPFFKFGGIFKGITVLNILLYEVIAFLTVLFILSIILKLLTFFSGVIEKILNFTIILGIPSKILGLVLGLIEGYLLAFLILFCLSLPIFSIKAVPESKWAPLILTKTPYVSNHIEDTYQAFEEIYTIKDTYNEEDTQTFNAAVLDILLKHKIVAVKSVEKLVSSGKLKIAGVNLILEKYR